MSIARFLIIVAFAATIFAQTIGPSTESSQYPLTLFEAFLHDHPDAQITKTETAEIREDARAIFSAVSASEPNGSRRTIKAMEMELERDGQECRSYITSSGADQFVNFVYQLDRDRARIMRDLQEKNLGGTSFAIMNPVADGKPTIHTMVAIFYVLAQPNRVTFQCMYPVASNPAFVLPVERLHELAEAVTKIRNALR